MNDHASPSSDAIAAAFPHTVLERVNGTPGREDIDDAQEIVLNRRKHHGPPMRKAPLRPQCVDDL